MVHVPEILAELQYICKVHPFMKQQVCDKLAEVFVQIPPALLEGMEDLAWLVPEALCATIHQCNVNCCAVDSPPEQVHLSLAGKDKTKMGVTWVTLNATATVVQYGLSKDSLSKSVEGTIDTYTASGWVPDDGSASQMDDVSGPVLLDQFTITRSASLRTDLGDPTFVYPEAHVD